MVPQKDLDVNRGWAIFGVDMQVLLLYRLVIPFEARRNRLDFKEFEQGVGFTWNPKPVNMTPWQEAVLHAAVGLAGEAGEIMEEIKKNIFMGRTEFMTPERMLKEAGDVEYYVTVLANLFGFTKEQVCTTNNKKLAARYPDGFVKGGGNRTGEGA